MPYFFKLFILSKICDKIAKEYLYKGAKMDLITIDEIIYSIKNDEWENIINYFYEYRLDRFYDKTDYLQKLLKNIACKIDDDCFKVIYNNIKQKNYSNKKLMILTNILVHMSDDKKKQCLETENLDNICSTELIKSLDDIVYKKNCVDNGKKFKLNNSNKMEIIENINEVEYFIKCIERKKEIGLHNNDIFELIKLTKKSEFIKNCIEECKTNNKYKLKPKQILELIFQINDEKFMQKCIENRKDYELSTNQVFEILLKIKDVEFLKTCIKKRNELDLNKNQIVEIIKKTNDIKFIKKCIFNKEQFGFLGMHIFDLIKEIEDVNFLKKCIYLNDKLKLESYMIKGLINVIDDEKFTKKCIIDYKKIGINSYTTVNLIETLNDEKFTKKCILNNKKLGLDSNLIKGLTAKLKNKKDIKEVISKAKKIGLSSNDIISLIKLIGNEKYTQKCILKAKKIGLESCDITELIVNIKDRKFVNDCIKNYNKIGINKNDYHYMQILYDDNYFKETELQKTKTKINLPPEMTIGMEIESCGRSKDLMERLRDKFFTDWNVDTDITIKPDKKSEVGTEISSPIFKGNHEKNTKEIVNVCKILNDIGNYSNNSCGAHIHIGVNYLKSTKSWSNLLEILSNTEELLYIISNEKGNIPRKEITTFAVPFSLRIKKSLKKYKIKLNDIKDVEELKKEIKNILNKEYKGVTRYRGINFDNITNNNGKNTIEIRMPNGTVGSETWIQNINLFGGIFKISRELAELQFKDEEELSKDEKRKIYLFNKLTNGKLKNKDKLQILLNLAIDEREQSEYIARYNVNSKLLKEKHKFRQKLKVEISKKPLRINKKEKEKNKEKVK